MADSEHELWVNGSVVEAPQLLHKLVLVVLVGAATGEGLGCNIPNLLIDNDIVLG
jgi:hypothetical protein